MRDIAVGDRVVINPMAVPEDIIGNGGSTGALADYLLIKDAVRGRSIEVIPDHVPFEVAARSNEPMAVARHAVNRVAPGPPTRCWSSAPARSVWASLISLKSAAWSNMSVVAGRPVRPVGQGAAGGR